MIEPQRTSFDRLTGFDESPSESFEPREIEGDRDEGFGLSSEADLGESDGDPRSSPASRAESRSEKSVPHSLGWVQTMVLACAMFLGPIASAFAYTLLSRETVEEPPLTRWEYAVRSPDDVLLDQALKGYGSLGWEIVSARRATSRYSDGASYEMILKRPKQPDPTPDYPRDGQNVEVGQITSFGENQPGFITFEERDLPEVVGAIAGQKDEVLDELEEVGSIARVFSSLEVLRVDGNELLVRPVRGELMGSEGWISRSMLGPARQ